MTATGFYRVNIRHSSIGGLLWPFLAVPALIATLALFAVYLHVGGFFDERKAVKSGYSQLPEARQIDELFGEADHFISGPRNAATGYFEWCTNVYFGGRYELGMRVDVDVDFWTNNVRRFIGRPKFYLFEVESVDILPDGRISVSYRSQHQHEFGTADWAKIVAARGDFSAIGIQLDTGHPIPNFDSYVAGLPHRRFGP